MATASHQLSAPRGTRGLGYSLHVLRVIAGIEFKMKYADSAMGYVWSLAKPLAYFGVLWLVFGHFFKTGIEEFPLFLLIGLVVYLFFIDAVGLCLPSIVTRGSILRRLAFPPLVIPLSVAATAGITFCVNVLAVAIFVAASGIAPSADWLLIVPLLLELFAFIIGVGLLAATLFVRFRDVAQLWDLTSQLLIFAVPIMYPVTILPSWAQKVVFVNPFVQIVQDLRLVILGAQGPTVTAGYVLADYGGRLLPLAIALGTFAAGFVLFRRDAPRFAELV